MADTTYATLATLKTMLGISGSTEDTWLQTLLNTAADSIDDYCGSTFVAGGTSVTEVYSGDGTPRLKLWNAPVISVTSLAINDTAVASTAYEIDTKGGWLEFPTEDGSYDARLRSYGYLFAVGTRNIDVTYVYGWVASGGAIPNQINVATLLHAKELYQGAQQHSGIASESLGPRSVSYLANAGEMSSQVKGLLSPYRIPKVRG